MLRSRTRGMCSAIEDQAIVDEITWIARLVEIKIKSKTQNVSQEEDQGEQKDLRD